MKRLILIFPFILFACKSNSVVSETRIRDTVHIIVLKIIIDSGRAEVIKTYDDLTKSYIDSLFQTVKLNGKDTVIKISYNPVQKQFKWQVRPDTIYYITRDTLLKQEIIEKRIETPFMSKVGIFGIGAIVAVILLLLIIGVWKYFIRKGLI